MSANLPSPEAIMFHTADGRKFTIQEFALANGAVVAWNGVMPPGMPPLRPLPIAIKPDEPLVLEPAE